MRLCALRENGNRSRVAGGIQGKTWDRGRGGRSGGGGHLRGAALDVTTPEPLPADNPLWDMPQVIISPHSASTSDKENHKITELFCENLQRFLKGEDLVNVLDVNRLY